MAKVRFFSAQKSHTGGQSEMQFEVANYRMLRQQIIERFPTMPAALLDEVMVAIGGKIVHRPFNEPIAPDSEVVFVGRIGAG